MNNRLRNSIYSITTSAVVFLSGCSTIVFDNGLEPQSPTQDWKMKKHHIGGIYELFEFQDPKNLDAICEGQEWEHIATYNSFTDVLLHHIIPVGIYAPKTTYTKCSNTADITDNTKM